MQIKARLSNMINEQTAEDNRTSSNMETAAGRAELCEQEMAAPNNVNFLEEINWQDPFPTEEEQTAAAQREKRKRLQEEESCRFTQQILSGVEYIHRV